MKKIMKSALKRWKLLYISYKVLIIICMLTFASIIYSVFNTSVDESTNLIIIRTVFASIIGFLLENTTKNSVVCNDKIMFFRNAVVGLISITITIVVIISYIYNIDASSHSLVLLKDILFSCIGFLISASEACGSK
ncbi:MAG: hypothetical protein ACRC68_05840 [Clostridium sp.]